MNDRLMAEIAMSFLDATEGEQERIVAYLSEEGRAQLLFMIADIVRKTPAPEGVM
jgi:hypothetical protein